MFASRIEDETKADDFHRGENSEANIKSETPAQLVQSFVEHRSAGVTGIVESTVAYSKGLTSFHDDAEKLTEFLQALHEAKVLTKEEVASGLSPKSDAAASKMKKISEYADVIRDERILPLLSAGYSVLYEVALLFQELERRQQGVAHLRARLMTSNGPISRSWLKGQRAKLEENSTETDKKAVQVELPKVDPSDAPSIQPTATADEDIAPEVGQPNEPAAEADKTPVAAVLMTVSSKDVSRLDKALQENGDPDCLTLRDQIEDRAVLLVHTKASTLISMQAIIKSLGFDRCSRIGLVGEVTGNEITSSGVMALYVRGGLKGIAETINWRSEKGPVALADRILAGIEGRRVHLFAKSQSDGWDSFVGEENWQS
jgi:hypothetical protein